MKPGPGFGDLSHPTTNLMLKLMPNYVKGKDVIDIGCGSGVLSIAAYLMGARSVRGIDICPEAVTHAQENAQLNRCDISFSTEPLTRINNNLILINMISSEQRPVWEGIETCDASLCIASGFLEEENLPYSILEGRKIFWMEGSCYIMPEHAVHIGQRRLFRLWFISDHTCNGDEESCNRGGVF